MRYALGLIGAILLILSTPSVIVSTGMACLFGRPNLLQAFSGALFAIAIGLIAMAIHG